jgi:hypothetical protein
MSWSLVICYLVTDRLVSASHCATGIEGYLATWLPTLPYIAGTSELMLVILVFLPQITDAPIAT